MTSKHRSVNNVFWRVVAGRIRRGRGPDAARAGRQLDNTGPTRCDTTRILRKFSQLENFRGVDVVWNYCENFRRVFVVSTWLVDPFQSGPRLPPRKRCSPTCVLMSFLSFVCSHEIDNMLNPDTTTPSARHSCSSPTPKWRRQINQQQHVSRLCHVLCRRCTLMYKRQPKSVWQHKRPCMMRTWQCLGNFLS